MVAYFSGTPQKGSPDIATTYDGVTYQFATPANRDAFLANPEKFRPAYGGFCAIAMTEGSVVDAHPEAFLIQDGRLLLFYALKFAGIFWDDTRRQWKKDPQKFLVLGDEVYKKFTAS